MFNFKCTIQAFMRITIYQQQSMCQWPESPTPVPIEAKEKNSSESNAQTILLI